MVLTFHPFRIKSLGIIFLLQFRASNVLGLVKNTASSVLKYMGNTSCIVFFPKPLRVLQLVLG